MENLRGLDLRKAALAPQITFSKDGEWVGNPYASIDSLNCDQTLFSAIAKDHVAIYKLDGTKVIDTPIEPLGDFMWSLTDPSLIYFHIVGGNTLYRYDVSTAVRYPEHVFADYKAISGKGEKCFNGECWALIGDDRDIFVFELATGAKGQSRISGALDSLYMTPDNNVIVSGPDGINAYDREMRFLGLLAPNNGHKDVTRDTDGREVMIYTDNRDNGIYKVPIDGRPRTLLTTLPWPVACDIACPAQGPPIVSTYSLMTEYPGQALKVALDGSGATVLCETGSVQILLPPNAAGERLWAYGPQPKTCVSRTPDEDGNYLLLGSSNFGKVDMDNPNYCDLFLWTARDASSAIALIPAPSLPLPSTIPSGLRAVKFPPNKDYWIHILTDAQGNPTVEEFEN